jgi:hypothetical protein
VTGIRPKQFVANTPLPALPQVTLYQDTWNDHIIGHHPEMRGREGSVHGALSQPSCVYESSSDPNRAIFISDGIKSQRGSPLAVYVDRSSATVCSAYYSRRLTKGAKLWGQE